MNSDPEQQEEPEENQVKNDEIYDSDEDPLLPSELQAQAESENGENPQITALIAERDTARDQTLRALAEAENTRKRAAKEREDASKFAMASFARDMIVIADNLGRAIEATPDDALEDVRIKNLFEGIEATQRELMSNLEKHGIEKLEPMDEPFDPNFHEVMFETPGTGKPAGTIIQIMEVGYKIKDRLLRPARVGIAKDDGSSPTPSTDPGAQIDTEA